MNKIYPVGYSYKKAGIIIAVFLGIWSAVIITCVVIMTRENGVDYSAILPFLLCDVIIIAGLILSDITIGKKAKKKIQYMQEMFKNECIKGDIILIEERPYILGRELSPEKLKKTRYRAKNRAYRIKVTYIDPYSSEIKTAQSELYLWFQFHEYDFKNRKMLLTIRDDYANVYVSPDGDAWVEPIVVDNKI